MTKKNINHMYAVKRSRAGLGLFAVCNITKGSWIIEYVGERISHAEADRRGGRYLFSVNDVVVVDGKGRDNIARYINHSCAPNAEAVIEDDTHIMIYAIADIAAGTEITYDYGSEYVEEFITGRCQCARCLCDKNV